MGADFRVSGNTVTPMVRELRHNPQDWCQSGEPVDLSCVESVEWVRFGPCGATIEAYRGEVFDADQGQVLLSAVGWPTDDGAGGALVPWTDLEGLTRWRIRVTSCADLDGTARVWEFPESAAEYFHVFFRKGSDMTAAVRVPVIPACKDEVDRGTVLPAPVGGPELFTLVDGAGVVLGLYSNSGTAYELVSTGGGSAVEEVGEGSALPTPATSTWELFRLQGSTNPLTPDGLYRLDDSTTPPTWVEN